jgi:hypothetical protein
VSLRRFVIVASWAALAGCSDSKTGPTGFNGTLSFNYSGGISGTFNVTGQMPTSGAGQETSSWAAGEVVTTGTDAGIYAAAISPRSASSHDFVVVIANRTTEGTATIDYDNCVSVVCSTVFFDFNASNGGGLSVAQACYLQTGSVVITDIDDGRIKGTFSGSGVCESSTGSFTAFTVTNGSFDVPNIPGAA